MTINSIGTHIKVADFAKSKKFYESLGFTKVFQYGPNVPFKKDNQGNVISVPEHYNGITFQQGGCKLEIGENHVAVKPKVFQERVTSSKVSLMIYVDSIAILINQCKKAGIPLEVGPRHYYWGTLEAVVKDPDGLVLVFIAPYSEKEAKTIHADETWGTSPKE